MDDKLQNVLSFVIGDLEKSKLFLTYLKLMISLMWATLSRTALKGASVNNKKLNV